MFEPGSVQPDELKCCLPALVVPDGGCEEKKNTWARALPQLAWKLLEAVSSAVLFQLDNFAEAELPRLPQAQAIIRDVSVSRRNCRTD